MAIKGNTAAERRPRTLTTGQVAKLCRVSQHAVTKWIDAGRLKGWRIPGSQDRRVDEEVLREFLAAYGMPTPASMGLPRSEIVKHLRDIQRGLLGGAEDSARRLDELASSIEGAS